MYQRSIHRALQYLKDEASKEIDIPTTNLGKIDLMFELSRRIAKAYGLPDLQFFGKPIGPAPDGPLVPLAERSKLPERDSVTPELADRITRLIYERWPGLFYELAEERIRQLHLKELTRDLSAAFDRLEPEGVPKTIVPRTRINQEINMRLHQMCGCPEIK